MDHKTIGKYKRRLALLLLLLSFFVLTTSEYGEMFGFVSRVTADETFPEDLNKNIVEAAVSKLGQGYAKSPNPGAGLYDCTALVRTCLMENQFGNVPSSSRNWYSRITGKNLNLTYKGATLESGAYVYCADVAEFRAQMNNNANKGKILVLTTATEHNTLAQSGVLKEGAIEIYYNPGDSFGHVAVIVGQITPKGVATGSDFTVNEMHYATYKYGKQAFKYLTDRYNISKALYQVGGGTTDAIQYAVNAGAGNSGAYTMTNGYSNNGSPGLYQVGGHTDTGHNIWATDFFGSPQPSWSVLQVFNQLNRNAYGDSTIWKIEALSPRFGVALTNNAGGVSEYKSASYVVYFKDWSTGYYYGLLSQCFTTDGTATYTGPSPAYSAVGYSVPGLGGGKAMVTVATGITADGLADPIAQDRVINTPRGVTAVLFSGYHSDAPTLTVYVHETSAAYGKTRPGVWKLTLKGSANINANTEITSATYYPSFADCVGDTNGVAIENENALSEAQMIETGRTAMYGQGSSASNANFEIIHADECKKPPVEGLGLLVLTKTDESGTAPERNFTIEIYAENAYTNGHLRGVPLMTLSTDNGELELNVSELPVSEEEEAGEPRVYYMKEGRPFYDYEVKEKVWRIVVTETGDTVADAKYQIEICKE